MNEDKFETMELAVKEQSDELAKINQQLRDMITTINLLRNVVSDFQEKLNTQNITVNADTRPIQEIMNKGISNFNLMVERALGKQRSNNWQLFLQSDAKKWLVILVVAIIFITYLYNFLVHYFNR